MIIWMMLYYGDLAARPVYFPTEQACRDVVRQITTKQSLLYCVKAEIVVPK